MGNLSSQFRKQRQVPPHTPYWKQYSPLIIEHPYTHFEFVNLKSFGSLLALNANKSYVSPLHCLPPETEQSMYAFSHHEPSFLGLSVDLVFLHHYAPRPELLNIVH